MYQKNRIMQGIALLIQVTIIMVLITGFISAETRSLVRDSIPDKYKWDLSHIYPDWSAWETDLARLEPLIDSFQALQGSLSGSADNLLNAFRMRDRIDRLFDSVSTYV
ncbi:MAG TPA: hypothetical protein ENH25_01710, partial [candidate division Zixibacteria bacterium]|nr:hypothetical protein [candidate division Zixibacteria bacterium]